MGKRQRRRERERIDALINTPLPKIDVEKLLGSELSDWQWELMKPSLRGETNPRMFVMSTTRRR